MTNFFSTQNVHNAVWALLIVLIGFGAGLLWKYYTGPDEVKIVNAQSSKKDTTYTIVQFQPLQVEERKIKQVKAVSFPTKISGDKIVYQASPTLVDSLIKLAIPSRGSESNFSEIKTVSSNTPPEDNLNETLALVNRPEFTLPIVVKGYTDQSINSYASIDLLSENIKKREPISVKIKFFDKSVLNKITPVFVSVLKKNLPNNYTLIWKDQFNAIDTRNKIKFAADFRKDDYELVVGFYFKDAINNQFPDFYYKKFVITIY